MVAQADLSGIVYLLPIFSFIIVWIVVYAVLSKMKIPGEKWIQIFLAFVFATIFVSAIGARTYVLHVTVWFAVFLISLFLIMVMLNLVGKDLAFLQKGIGVFFVIVTLLVFVISGIFIFSEYLSPYLPWNSGVGANPDVLMITSWFFSSRILGAVFLLAISAIVTWLLVKAK